MRLHAGLVRTRPSFTIVPAADRGCELQFCHEGLTPQLECFDTCRQGWDHFLPSLRAYVESGLGMPMGSPR